MVSSNVSSRSREKVLGGLRIGRILFTRIGGNLGYLLKLLQPKRDQLPRTRVPGTSVNRLPTDAPGRAECHYLRKRRKASGRRSVVSAEENKAVVRRYFDEFHTQRQHDILEEIIAPRPARANPPSHRHAAHRLPQLPHHHRRAGRRRDKVATVWSGSGTHQGPWQSPAGTVAPTGNEVR